MTTTPTRDNFDSTDEQHQPRVDMQLHVSTRTVLRVLVVVSLFLLMVEAVQQIAPLLVQIVVAAFLAVAADSAVRAIQRRGVSRGKAVAIVMAALVLVLALMLLIFVPPVVEQADRLIERAPEYSQDLRNSDLFRRLDARFGVTDKFFDQAELLATTLPSQLGGAFSAILGGIFSTITMLFLIVFMLLGGSDLLRGVLRLFPQLTERRAWIVIQGAYRNIGPYFIGALTIALIAGTSLTLVLLALGTPHALPLGLFMALLVLIPLIGATIGAIPAVVVTFVAEGMVKGLIVLGFIIVYQQVENVMIQPRIQGRAAALPAIVIFLSVLIGAQLMGVVGALFAVPIAGVISIVYRQYLEVVGRSDVAMPSLHESEPAPEPTSGTT